MALQKAIEWLKKFYQHITDAAARYKARADQIAKAAASVSGKAAGADVKVSASGFGKVLVVGEAVPEGSAFAAAFTKYLSEADALSKAQRGLASAGGKALADIVSESDPNKLNDAIDAMAKVIVDSAQGERSANRDLGGDGLEVFELKLGFANKSFYSVVASGESISKSQFLVDTSTGAKEVGDVGEVDPLDPKDVASVAGAAAAHLEAYKGFSEEIGLLDKALSTIAAAVKAQGEPDSARAVYAGAARAYISSLTKGAKSLRSYDITIIKAALDYSAASLQALKGQAEADVAPEAKPAEAAAA